MSYNLERRDYIVKITGPIKIMSISYLLEENFITYIK